MRRRDQIKKMLLRVAPRLDELDEVRLAVLKFCHDFSQLCRRARQRQRIASGFGTPVYRGCNDSVVAEYRRIPYGSRGGGRAGARIRRRLGRGGGGRAPAP